MKLIYGGFEQLLGTTAGNTTLDQSSSRSSTSKGLSTSTTPQQETQSRPGNQKKKHGQDLETPRFLCPIEAK
jgi:hypothetical protein